MAYSEQQVAELLARQDARMIDRDQTFVPIGQREPKPAASWSTTGRCEIPDDRRHQMRDTYKDKRTGEQIEVTIMRCLGDKRLSGRICSTDRHGKIVNGFSDRLM
jgi:hypothetical protein